MKKIIVFGGAGFLGSHVADALTAEGYEVTIFDINESNHLQPNQRFVRGDITDQKQIAQAIVGHDVVYNFAGIADIDEAAENPVKTITTNILGNTNVLEACRMQEIKRYVFASTIYVYSSSGSFYRSSKQACELIIEEYNRKYGLDFTILRYGSLYGPRASEKNSMHNFILQALNNGKIVRQGDGNELRDYIHVYDASQLSVKILSEEFRNQHVILSGQQKIKIKDLLLMIKEMLNNKVELEFREQDHSSHHYNITPFEFAPKLAKKITGYTHVDLGQGVLDLMNTLYKEKHVGQDQDLNIR